MSDTILIIGGLGFVFSIILIISIIVQFIRRKPLKKLCTVFGISFSVFIIFESIGSMTRCHHDYLLISQVEATCASNGEETYRCSKCNKENLIRVETLEHDMVTTETVESTYTAEGKTILTCTRCGIEKSEVFPKLECTHAWKEQDGFRVCTQCGNKEESTTFEDENEAISASDELSSEILTDSTDDEYLYVDTTKIDVTYKEDYTDEDKMHLKVYVRNNSEQIFSGNIHLYFQSESKKLGSDTIVVTELLPGRESWSNVIINICSGTIRLKTDFTEVSFVEIDNVVSEVNEEITQKIKNSFRLNFDTTTWYSDVTDITVYSDGNCIVTIQDDRKNESQLYASAIWSCGKEYGVSNVCVVDQKENILCQFP